PRPSLFEFLLHTHHQTGDAKLLAMVEKTLVSMADGGIHDQLGGGFHRYSTDAMWLVPHFEKMLYDNAQLASAYIDAHRATGNPRLAEVAASTLDYVRREMTDAAGGFYSATDADSQSPEGHREEGIFFTWTPAEIREILPPKLAETVIAAYAVTPTGNFEGRSILHTPRPLADVAASRNQTVDQLKAELAEARAPLLVSRAKRTPPLRDDKIITSWNGLMISAFAQGALYLDRATDRDQAVAAGQFVWDKLRTPEGRLYRNFHRGRAQHMGVLDDYACVIQGYLDLLSATSDTVWLTRAIELQATVEAQFADPQTGAYFLTANDAETLLTRERPSHDGAEPSGNSVTARNLLRLATLTGDSSYQDRAHTLLAAFSQDLAQGASLTKMLAALGTTLGRPVEVFIVSPQAGDPAPLLAKFRTVFLPDVAVFVTAEGAQQTAAAAVLPGLADRGVKQGKPTAFVCEQGRCLLPTTDPEQFEQQLRSFQGTAKTPPPSTAKTPPI
ncbi:MAG: thioredoxin domain-containing protein, partial [Nannocystaceae bacterium]